MAANPLKQFFRQPALYVKLPSRGIWYGDGSVELNEDGEVAVYPMGAIDDILLNTPDAMLNGKALEKVLTNCIPEVKNVKRVLLPDLEALFVGIKAATNSGKIDYDRKCPKCQHDNSFDLNCQGLLDSMTMVDDSDLTIKFNDDLLVYVKPYDFEMRQLFIKREFDEQKTLRALDAANTETDELVKASLIAESIDRLSHMTFTLVSRSIEKIVMIKDKVTITEQEHINDWLVNISKAQADIVIDAVNRLNVAGVNKKLTVSCVSCNHTWEDEIGFDPSSFFAKRS